MRTAQVSEQSPSNTDLDSSDTLEVDDEAEELSVVGNSDRLRWVPLPLTRLDGLAFEPKVGGHRVAYVGTNTGVSSDMTMGELFALAKFFPWPEGVKLRLPCADGGSLSKYQGCTMVYEEALKAGFRLPLHPFICDFLSDTKLCPAQFTPNTWRCILVFLFKFKEWNAVPSYEAFKCMYDMRSCNGIYTLYFPGANVISYQRNARSWGKKWFLVCQSEAPSFNFPMYPGYCHMGRGYTTAERKRREHRVQEYIQMFKSLPEWKNDLDMRQLEEAGLSLPHPKIGQAAPVDMYEQYIAKRKLEVGCFGADETKIEGPSKKAKTCPSQLMDLVSIKPPLERSIPVHPATLAPVKKEIFDISQEEDPEEEEPEEDAPISSVRVDQVYKDSQGGHFPSFTPDSEGKSSIGTLCREVLRRVPEIVLAGQCPEELERQLKESRQENAELRREKAELVDDFAKKAREFQSQIQHMERDKKTAEMELIETRSKLERATQKARELLKISSLLKID